MKNVNEMFSTVKLNNRFSSDKKEVNQEVQEEKEVIDEAAKHDEILQSIYNEVNTDVINTADLRKIFLGLGKAKDAWWSSFKKGYLEKVKRGSYRISKEGMKLVDTKGNTPAEDDMADLEVNTKAKNVQGDLDKAVKKKARKYKVPKGARGEGFDTFFRTVLQNMNASVKKNNAEKLMLQGNPGAGKTSAVNQLATLFGMYLITIEGAHISEEQIINIPYVVTKGHNSTNHVASYVATDIGFEVQDAKSSLVSQLESLGFIRDEEHQKMLNQNKLMKKMYLKYKEFIDAVRRTNTHKSGFSNICFVDEFYRCFSEEQEVQIEFIDKDFEEFVQSKQK